MMDHYFQFDWAPKPGTDEQHLAGLIMSEFIGFGRVAKAIRLSANRRSRDAVQVGCFVNDNALKKIGLQVSSVYSSDVHQHHWIRWKALDGKKKKNWDAMIFSQDFGDDCWMTLSFRIYFKSTINRYNYLDRFDHRLGQQLWKSLTEESMTDVELFVGQRSFHAHKFILASRSPVFSAKLDYSTQRVEILHTDPDIFHQFLYFLYTGRLEHPVGPELGQIADKYQVETLMMLCQDAAASDKARPRNLEQLFDYFDDLIKQHQPIDTRQME